MRHEAPFIIMWEFYANATKWEKDLLFVKGKKVWFLRAIINQFFTLYDLKTLEYNALMSNGFNARQIIETLVASGT